LRGMPQRRVARAAAAALLAALSGLAAAQPPARSQLAVGATVAPSCSFSLRTEAPRSADAPAVTASCSHDSPRIAGRRDRDAADAGFARSSESGTTYVTVTY